MPVNLGGTFMRALWAFGLFVLGSAGSLTAASADTTLTCPLPQATRTIVEPMPPGWATEEQVSGVTGYRVDNSGGQERLICEYGDAGVVQYVVPPNQDCSKLPGRRFQCAVLPPPGPVVVSDGPLSLSDNGIVDLDAGGGQPDLRLRADNPFLRLIQPINGAQLSPQGTHRPSFDDCRSASFSGSPIPQAQMPTGTWACVATGSGNLGRIRVAGINGVPGVPVPMTIYLEHTTWSPAPGGPGGGPGDGFGGGLGGPGGGPGGPGGGFGGGPGGPGGGPGGPGGGFGGGPGGPGGGFGGGAPHSAGSLVVAQTYLFDLDEGQVSGSNDNADFWFQAVTPVQMFIKPMNGAQIAVGNRQDRGRRGCRSETFSSAPVPLNTLSAGDSICASTSAGRISQFRIDAISPGSPKTLNLSYVTWDR